MSDTRPAHKKIPPFHLDLGVVETADFLLDNMLHFGILMELSRSIRRGGFDPHERGPQSHDGGFEGLNYLYKMSLFSLSS